MVFSLQMKFCKRGQESCPFDLSYSGQLANLLVAANKKYSCPAYTIDGKMALIKIASALERFKKLELSVKEIGLSAENIS